MTEAQIFETEKNRKAFIYTCIICGIILLLFIIIKWKDEEVAIPVVQDLIEINLGNNEEGFGEQQPLIKGNKTASQDDSKAPVASASNNDDKIEPDDLNNRDGATVVKPSKVISKIKSPTPVESPVTKPQKAKIIYPGTTTGPPGNNPSEDNGYRNQGNDPNGKGDKGDPNGNKDSYGNTPGGKIGGPKVISGNRKIVRYYSFTGDLAKATIFAVIKVAANGQGTFIRIVKPSTSFNAAYGVAISNYLRNIQFDKADDESNVTVQFNFNVN